MSSSLQARFAVSYSDFSLQVEFSLPGEGISALFGPSGSGKTTCLRAMAGLTRPADGFFAVGEEIWQDERQGIFVPPHRRSIGYVFQEASLFSHLSVTGNLQFGVKRLPRGGQGGPKAHQQPRAGAGRGHEGAAAKHGQHAGFAGHLVQAAQGDVGQRKA